MRRGKAGWVKAEQGNELRRHDKVAQGRVGQ